MIHNRTKSTFHLLNYIYNLGEDGASALALDISIQADPSIFSRITIRILERDWSATERKGLNPSPHSPPAALSLLSCPLLLESKLLESGGNDERIIETGLTDAFPGIACPTLDVSQ